MGKESLQDILKKSITIKSNARTEMTRIYIEGVMEGGNN